MLFTSASLNITSDTNISNDRKDNDSNTFFKETLFSNLKFKLLLC